MDRIILNTTNYVVFLNFFIIIKFYGQKIKNLIRYTTFDIINLISSIIFKKYYYASSRNREKFRALDKVYIFFDVYERFGEYKV